MSAPAAAAPAEKKAAPKGGKKAFDPMQFAKDLAAGGISGAKRII